MEFAARLVENRPLARGSFVLRLSGCEALADAWPGQFVMVRGAWGRDPLLPRAFSILRTRDGECDLLVKAIGRGTRLLETTATGATLHLLGPLGSRFAAPVGEWPGDLLVAGGVGVAPLLWYAERERGARHHFVYGARTAADLVLLDEIAATGATLTLTTEDGSSPAGGPRAIRGRVTDALAEILARRAPGRRVLTCGPNAMMRAVVEQTRAAALPCLVSVEGEMACGIGACLGCAVPAAPGQARPFRYACVDGPVFDAQTIVIP